MSEKVLVVGAGIAGFTVGINLLREGYDVTIVEKNKDVGGLCFGYFVDDHYIDACIHWLMGTNKKSMLHKEWKNIGAFDKDTEFIRLPKLATFDYEGSTVTFYRDLKKTERELIKLSPEDKKAIHKFIGSVKDMGSIMGLVLKNKKLNGENLLHSLPHSGHIMKCMRESREDYAMRFTHPALQFAFKNAQTGYNNMFFFLDFYGLFSTNNADVPVGGAYYMVQRIKNKFLELGGKLELNTEITRFLVRNGRVSSVRTSKGLMKADHYVSTIDPYFTTHHLLAKKYRIHLFNRLHKTVDKRSISSCFNVYIAVKADVTNIDVPTIFSIKPTKIGHKEINSLLIRPYHFDKSFIKDGETTVSLFVDQNQDDYRYYKRLDDKEYKKVIKDQADALIALFLERYPQYEGKVKFLSCFSPIELEERTNTSFGSIQSYSFTDRGMMYIYSGDMRKLDNLYLAGQWNRAIGGTPTALLSGLDVVKEFKKIKK